MGSIWHTYDVRGSKNPFPFTKGDSMLKDMIVLLFLVACGYVAMVCMFCM